MKFEDTGLILSTRRLQESSYILSVFTQSHGLVKGVFRANRKNKSEILTGNIVDIVWSARLPEHLGTITVEHSKCTLSQIASNRVGILILNSSIELCLTFLHEMEPHKNLYDSIIKLIDTIDDFSKAVANYIDFELEVLKSIGFGLDLSQCVSTKSTDNLEYISPRSGCAVSLGAGQLYKDKLFKFPAYLKKRNDEVSVEDAHEVLKMLNFFMEKFFFQPYYKKCPKARDDLMNWLWNSVQSTTQDLSA